MLIWVNVLLVYASSSLQVPTYYLAKFKMAKTIKAKDQLLVVESVVPLNPYSLACLGVGYLWPC
jgi:hypothetical protein